METTAHGWKVFDSDLPILTYSYSFGPGTANALAVGVAGGLVIVSPPYRVADGVFGDLSPYGPVVALVASNAFHHRLSGSAPGLRFNNIGPMFMVKDKAALKRWLATEYQKGPPRWLIAAQDSHWIVDLYLCVNILIFFANLASLR